MKHPLHNLPLFVGCLIGDTLRWGWQLVSLVMKMAHQLTPILLAYLIYRLHN